MSYPFIRFAVIGLTVLMTQTVHAIPFPRGCEPSGFGYRDNFVVLNPTGKQTLFLMRNRSTNTIQLERHETRDVFMSPKLQSKLAASNWAAFASDEQNLYFQCQINDDNNTLINCSNVLEICQYPRAKFALSNMGNYWVSTNKTQDAVIKESVAKGIYLKW